MDNATKITVELEVVAQRYISQYMINNERIESEIKEGVKRAFENIDLSLEVEKSVRNAIEQAIKSSSDWGKIRDAVKKHTDSIVDSYIENSINKFKTDFPTLTS